MKDVLRNAKKHNSVLVIIGPEGGFEEKEIKGKVERDVAALEAANKQHIVLNVNPAIYQNSTFAKMDDETRPKYLALNALANGAPLSADEISIAIDPLKVGKTAQSKQEQELQKAIYDNDYSKLNNIVKGVEASIAQRTEDIKVQYEQGKLTEQEYNNAIKEQEVLQSIIKTYVDDQLKDTRVGKEKAELINTKYKGATFQLNIGIPGLGNAGAHIDAATLIHAGYDIQALLDKKGLTLSAEHEKNANEAAGLKGETF